MTISTLLSTLAFGLFVAVGAQAQDKVADPAVNSTVNSADQLASNLPTLKFRSDLWCPFVCEPGDHPGIIIEVVQKVLGSQYKIDFETINWARALADTREGVYDGVVGAAVADAPDFIYPKEAQAVAYYEFFTLKKKPWQFKGDLNGRKIGVINSYTYDEMITAMIHKKDPRFVVISGDKAQLQMVTMLQAGRVDTIYEDPNVFKSTLKKFELSEADFHSAGGPPQPMQEIFVGFSPKLKSAPGLAAEIDAGMLKMRKSGEFKKLLEKYGMKDWK